MKRRLPPEAFAFYLGLGHDRSYRAVAERFGVSKRTVTAHAARENWAERATERDRRVREEAEQKAGESLDAMNARHLKAARAVQAKALEALRVQMIDSAMDAVRALDLALKQERLARGEPSERTAVTVEDLIRREYQKWLVPDDAPDGNGAAEARAEDEEDGDADPRSQPVPA